MTVARETWNFVAYLFDVKFENIIIFLSQSSGFGLSMLRLSHDQESTTGFSFIASPFFCTDLIRLHPKYEFNFLFSNQNF